jgi:hypothetical protein
MTTKINFLKVWDTKHHFSEKNLPALIHYKSKEGWSHYSMVLIENLALQWHKVLLVTWYPQAKEQFYQETKKIAKNTIIVNTIEDIKKYKNKQVIVIHDDDEKLCLDAIKILDDINERIIFIKNIDIFHKKLINTCLKYDKLILSGEIDACLAKEKVLNKIYNSILLFSQPKTKIPYKFIESEPYTGYIRSKNKEWYVRSA